MRKAGHYIDAMKHAAGHTPNSKHNLWHTLNDAGRALFGAHPWTWRQRTVTLAAVAGQDHIDLPLLFAHVVSATVENGGAFSGVELADIGTIHRLRQNAQTYTAGAFYCAFPQWEPQGSLEDAPTPRVDVFPTPTAAGQPTLRVACRFDWREIVENDLCAVPNIPPNFEEALYLSCRVRAVLIERQETSAEAPALAAELERLKREDGARQSTWGPMRGGVNTRPTRLTDGGRSGMAALL